MFRKNKFIYQNIKYKSANQRYWSMFRKNKYIYQNIKYKSTNQRKASKYKSTNQGKVSIYISRFDLCSRMKRNNKFANQEKVS